MCWIGEIEKRFKYKQSFGQQALAEIAENFARRALSNAEENHCLSVLRDESFDLLLPSNNKLRGPKQSAFDLGIREAANGFARALAASSEP
jgi:hypothetical protein